MTSPSTQKQCASSKDCKQSAIASYQGCSESYCMKHMNDHHRSLGEQLKPMLTQCNDLKKTLTQQTMKPDFHPRIKEINQWENESIQNIKETAKSLRQSIQKPTADHTDELSKELQQLTDQLKTHRENNNFIEKDINDCKQKLEALQAEIVSPSTILVNRCKNDSLVDTISISMSKMTIDSFHQPSPNSSVPTEENGQVVVHDESDDCAEIHGDKKYTSGCYEISLLIEQISKSWTFLGINSKSVEVPNASDNLSKSIYGWSSDNFIQCNGGQKYNRSKPSIEIKHGDTISLLLDCDNHKIAMINRRTNAEHKLDVDLLHCPFPWQIHVILCEKNSRVRILRPKN